MKQTKGSAGMIGSHKNRRLKIQEGLTVEEVKPRNRKERRALAAIQRKATKP
jgi:hypothetical protein